MPIKLTDSKNEITSEAVFVLKEKYQVGHPEKYSFSLPIKIMDQSTEKK